MSATEILKAAKDLSLEEKVELAHELWCDIAKSGFDSELTPEEIAELDRRAEDAFKNPGRGKPIEQVSAEIRNRYLARK